MGKKTRDTQQQVVPVEPSEERSAAIKPAVKPVVQRAVQPAVQVSPAPQIEPAYATATEAAVYMRISRGMVIKMAHQGEIPFRRFGRSFRFPWEWIRKYVPR
jgi:excisionase family DNA binding protein